MNRPIVLTDPRRPDLPVSHQESSRMDEIRQLVEIAQILTTRIARHRAWLKAKSADREALDIANPSA